VSVRWTHVDGNRVRYREQGSGPCVVIIAGLGLSSDFYRENVSGLARYGLRVVVPDLPGFGGTSGRKTGLDIADAAAWLHRFSYAIAIRSAVWVGHSIGCQIALSLAANHHERTTGLVLTGPTGARTRRRAHQVAALASVALREGAHVLWAVAREYVRTTPWQYAGWWLRAARDRPLHNAARVRAPSLILVGTRDPVPPRDFLAELLKQLPRSELQQVPGALHALPIEQPDEFNRRVAGFVHRVATE
jgi:2-hydroxy-6-oxonona-2,4-dienedioate hydrolase